jgi:hypothetical protein
MQLIFFYSAIILVFFFPGYFLLRAIFVKNYTNLSALEKLLITFVFSLASTNAIMLLMDYLNVAIIRKNLFAGIMGISFVFGVVGVVRLRLSDKIFRSRTSPRSASSRGTASKILSPHLIQNFTLRSPSYRQILLFITFLGLAVFSRGIYIADGIFPKTTDFGHHIYWANYISTNQELPTYSEKFIIGEHLPFAAVNILSGASYISPLAVIVLFLFNIFTLIGVFILIYWLAVPFNKAFQKIFPKIKKISAFDVALWGLFVIGILYPISAPQVKFVSGGVIGNIIGNFLIITAIYAFLKTITSTQETINNNKQINTFSKTPFWTIHLQQYINSDASFSGLFMIIIATLVYTHHLSSFVFIYSFITILISFMLLVFIFIKFDLLKFFKLLFIHLSPFFPFFPFLERFTRFKASLLPTIIAIFVIFFLFQVRTPSYLNSEAIDIAVGTPTKITRVGFGLSEIIERVGSWRVLFTGIFGVIGLSGIWLIYKNSFYNKKSALLEVPPLPSKLSASLPISPPRGTTSLRALISPSSLVPLAISLAILFAWAKILFLMSWKPGLLQVDIPSRRIITYLTYPLTIMTSFGIAYFFAIIKTKLSKDLFTFLFLFFIGIGIISGFSQDITANQRTTAGKFEISDEVNSKEVMQTYLAAIYLASNTDANDMVLKDHKFLEGDTWMKLFFMRDYKYPLSRTYDRRYEDIINKRETCTRDMVLKPNSEIGKQCFAETNTNYIVLKKGYDDAIFKKSPNFQQIYSSKTVTVFQKK